MNEQSRHEQIKSNFDDLSKSKAYSDENRRRIIPRFDDFYETGVNLLSCAKRSPRVLDLGAGTGLYAAYVARRYPDAILSLIDFSDEMLSLAKERFAARANVNFMIGDYTLYPFTEQFDIVISALSIHHLNADEKAALYRKIYDLLTPCGEFLNADLILSPSVEVQREYIQNWLAHMTANGHTPAEMERTRQSLALDAPSTVSAQLKWIADSGFTTSDCVYKYQNFATLYGKK